MIELRGDLAPGTKLSAGGAVFLLYELPTPFPVDASPRWIHAARSVRVVDVLDDGMVVEENSVQSSWQELPIASTPPAPPQAGSQQAAIDQWADAIIQAAPLHSAAFPSDAATDLLLQDRGCAYYEVQPLDDRVGALVDGRLFTAV